MSDLPPNPPTLATPAPKSSSTPPPLFVSPVETNTVTVAMPNILQDVKSDGGSDVFTVINGGSRQVELTTEAYESETEVAAPPVFKVIATNRISFGGAVLSVLNDAEEFNGKTLPPSNPTAMAYLAQRGQKVFIHFSCLPVPPTSSAFQTRKRATLFIVRQSSIILP